MSEHELLVSMDIGTRTVIGMAGFKDGDIVKILAWDIEEHKERSMFDGQVHDVELVAKAVTKVKESLEAQTGYEIKRVAVAAAGRSLKTFKVAIERDIDPDVEIERDDVGSLEIEGIQIAQQEIEKKNDDKNTSYFCVGYTIVNHYLNDNLIGRLEGHRGSKMAVEILATFLPRVVVDSLYSVIARAGLEVSSLTLEPIAAMNVVLHSNLRLLNVAMVDIGAGTSDIAITKNGSVVAFAMAPIAGDEITEHLAEEYLLDFNTAEKVKISLCKKTKIKFKDIMGFEHIVEKEEILEKISSSVRKLAEEISKKILEYNGKAPSAIFLIGGGSQIPLLTEYLAESLGMTADRIAVRRADIVKEVDIKNKKSLGPEFITPMGIASTAAKTAEKDFLQVTVNEKAIRLFNSKKLTIADSLVLSGVSARELIGKRGPSISVSINGRMETFHGEPSIPAVIKKNDERATLDTTIKNGDSITLIPANEGKAAKVTVKDAVGGNSKSKIFIDGREHYISNTFKVNGEIAPYETILKDGDILECETISKVHQLRSMLNIPSEVKLMRGKRVLDDNEEIINNDKLTLGVNEVNTSEELTQDDFNSMLLSSPKSITLTNKPIPLVTYKEPTIITNLVDQQPPTEEKKIAMELDIIFNGKTLKLKGNRNGYILADALNQSGVDFSKIKALNAMLINGRDANFADILNFGDRVDIKID